jgi:glycyl-tRNA synthetase beta chain
MIEENARTVLLEIGTEELPSSCIESALRQISVVAIKAFSASGLKCGNIKTYATPRRLVLIVEHLAKKTQCTTEEIVGPSLKVAKDAHGEYTHAAVGFAAKNGVVPEKLTIKTTAKGEYLSFIKKKKGEKTEKLLPGIFTDIIKSISFPKMMMWDDNSFKFARPVRNIISLYGKKKIKFNIAGINSSNWTVGLHTYDNSRIKIDLPESYIMTMKNKSVIVDQKERREELKKSIESVVESVGYIIPDEDLVDEVNYLVEYPSAVLCAFDKKYLDLPSEVLTVCMKKKQKCFAVNDKKGNFTNYFVGVKNGLSDYQEVVKEGYEKVVTARLADADFFYRDDLKNGLVVNIEKLKGVVFHKEIGTMYEKIGRIKQIANLFNVEFNMQIDRTLLERAIIFSKVDLVSKMVFEYPELQGTMGKIYAIKLGENFDVAGSIEQHYRPLSAFGQLPASAMAALISLADKIDTLVANFSIGLEPSGSADPYGLRRASIGFIRIVTEILPSQNLSSAIAKVFEFLPETVKNNHKAKDAYGRLINFFWHKIEGILESEGYGFFEVKAVINASRINELGALGSLRPKLIALQNARKRNNFVDIVAIFKRINNIINQARKQNVDILQTVKESLFVADAEKNLFADVEKTKTEIEIFISKNEYDKVFDKVLEIGPSIDNFFKKIIVIAEDESLKLNRISLLNYIKNIFAEFVDFSVL